MAQNFNSVWNKNVDIDPERKIIPFEEIVRPSKKAKLDQGHKKQVRFESDETMKKLNKKLNHQNEKLEKVKKGQQKSDAENLVTKTMLESRMTKLEGFMETLIGEYQTLVRAKVEQDVLITVLLAENKALKAKMKVDPK